MLAAYSLYGWVRGLVDDPAGAVIAFENARTLISIELALNLFVEPAVQAWADGVPLVIDVSSWLYINTQTTVTLGALALMVGVPLARLSAHRGARLFWALYPCWCASSSSRPPTTSSPTPSSAP